VSEVKERYREFLMKIAIGLMGTTMIVLKILLEISVKEVSMLRCHVKAAFVRSVVVVEGHVMLRAEHHGTLYSQPAGISNGTENTWGGG
jgi:hypothetical protein